jgi:diaminobutyrate-2-oxoglutarate transaminase
MSIFEQLESNVRSYCRSFPDVFTKAKGSLLYATSGHRYIDFFSGAGALNFGHNNDYIKERLIAYLQADGVAHALDMYTLAKCEFLEKFRDIVLAPRALRYKVQFCSPTGANAVEAALKLARKVTGRPDIFAFTGAYHGMSLGALSVTSGRQHRMSAHVPLTHVHFMPYETDHVRFDTLTYIEDLIVDSHSGFDKPAAIILETVQAEGGIFVAPVTWLQRLRKLCDEHDIILICDEIQVGCGRTGHFFSFERAGIIPDIVLLSKSISGFGQPMSLVLMKRELDVWSPGEHTGTFRGNQLAFVGAAAALQYLKDQNLLEKVLTDGAFLREFLLHEIAASRPDLEVRGIGMIWGIDLSACGGNEAARAISAYCFDNGLIVELVGRNDSVVKIIPPLTIERALLENGCEILKEAFDHCAPSQVSNTSSAVHAAIAD